MLLGPLYRKRGLASSENNYKQHHSTFFLYYGCNIGAPSTCCTTYLVPYPYMCCTYSTCPTVSSIGYDFFFCGEEQVETPVGVIPESDERHAHRSCTQTLLSFKSSCHKIGHRHYRQVKQQITAHHPPTQSLSLNCTYSNESFRASAQQRCTQT